MESSTAVADHAPPAVTTFTESSHESKVEQVANGTIESSVDKEKTVTQSVQKSGSEGQQSSIVQETKQETFSSSSVVVEATIPIPKEAVVVAEKNEEVVKSVVEETKENVNEIKVEEEKVSKAKEEPTEKPEEKPVEKPQEEPVAKPEKKPQEKPVEKPQEEPVAKPEKKPEEKPNESVEMRKPEINQEDIQSTPTENTVLVNSNDSEPIQVEAAQEVEIKSPKEEGSKGSPEQNIETKGEPVIPETKLKDIENISQKIPDIQPKLQEEEIDPKSNEIKSDDEKNESKEELPSTVVISKSNETKVEETAVQETRLEQLNENKTTPEEKKEDAVKADEKTATTGDGLEVPLVEKIMAPIIPPTETSQKTGVNNSEIKSSVFNDQKPKEQDIVKNTSEISKEIQQESIKQQLNEIITDIEKNVNITNDEQADNSCDERLDGKKAVDLQKIFTPATDVDEIVPGKNRKLFSSSSFYSPTIHPTVEDQVELARRISHSLSDISNHTSKGQSMYVNRKKRSVKWIHDDGHEEERFIEEHQETKENGYESNQQFVPQQMQPPQPSYEQQNFSEIEPKKVPLKLVMDPRHVQDLNSMRQYGYEPAPMSPEFGYELVNALNAPKGKGAELFAKRRKKAEKWVVDGSKSTPLGTPNQGSTITAFSDVGTQRVQHNMKLDQIQEKYQQPRVKMVRSPWEAALETGSVDNAFISYPHQQQPNQQQQIYSASVDQLQQYDFESSTNTSSLYSSKKDVQYQSSKQIKEQLSARDLAYRPNVPQGWNRPPVTLPAGIYTPPEIPTISSTTTSMTTENISNFSSTTTSSSFKEVPLPQQSAPLSFSQVPQQIAAAPEPIKKPIHQAQPKPYQSPTQNSYARPQAQSKPVLASQTHQKTQIVSTQSEIVSQKTGVNSSTVTPGILKKQIQLDAAVPVPPGIAVPNQSPIPIGTGRSGGKSPVPIFNTSPAPFGFPALSVQTPETIAQVAPASPTPMVPYLQTPKPLPMIVSTPLPNYTSSYNNAARPFNEFKDYYRPINMDTLGSKLVPPVVYTDF